MQTHTQHNTSITIIGSQPHCRGWLHAILIIIILVMTSLPINTLAQSNSQPDPSAKLGPPLPRDLLTNLDNPDLTIRSQVADRLINDRVITDEMVYYTITQSPDLTPEQHDRLLEIAEKRRLIQPGVIGIWIDNQLGPPGVGVGGVMRDAPSSQVLQTGDIILTLNGFQITGQDPGRELQFAVAASRAGEPLEMNIIRRGQPLTVNTRLADPRDLPEFRGSTLSTSRSLQWALIHDAISTAPVTIPLVDEFGSPVLKSIESISISSNSQENSTSDSQRRRNWQIENNFKSKLATLQNLQDNSRRLARITDSPSLSRAVENRAVEISTKLRKTATDYELFRQAAMSGSTTTNSSTDPRKQ